MPLPPGVKIDDIWPNRVQVKLERVEEKDVPVKIETTGELPSNLEVYSRSAMPARVMVRGPESVLKTLDAISTEKIDLKGRTGDFTLTQPLAVTDSKATIQRGDVSVTFRIGEKRVERSFTVPSGRGKNVRITLYGPASLLKNRKPDEFKITFDADDTPEVTLPSDMVNSVVVKAAKAV
ncbi:MAG: YbbR-like protein [Acidobacteria bacterium OLB17]|nr:MAG: YbbR-like protein [Acidobacteria bacterium OLB17]